MKNYLQSGLIVMLAIGLSFTSCKKTEKDDDLNSGTDFQEMANDELSVQAESDAMLSDVNLAVGASALGKGSTIKGASVNDSSFIGLKKIIITYNGENADGTRFRSGVLTITLISGAKWSDQDAVLELKYAKVISTRKSNMHTVEFNGTFYVRNVTGGKVFVNSLVIHKFWGAGTFLFDGETGKTWNINRKRTFTVNGNVYTMQTESDTLIDNSPVVTWGTNRKGVNFFTSITQPVIVNNVCPAGPISGVKTHSGLAKSVTVTFGVDQTGNPVTSGCPYGFKVDWKNKKDESKSAVLSY